MIISVVDRTLIRIHDHDNIMSWVEQIYQIILKSPDPMKVKIPNTVYEYNYGPLRFVLSRSPDGDFIWIYIYEDGRVEIYRGEINDVLTVDNVLLKKVFGELELILKNKVI